MDQAAEWRPVVGLEGRYEVSSEGGIRNAVNKRERRLTTNADGYRRFAFWDPRKTYADTMKVHIAVARAFIGPPPMDRPVIHHIDHNTANNRVSNLMYVTSRENHDFAMEAGRKGELALTERQYGNAKLSPDQVVAIRALQGTLSARQIATVARINVSHVYRVWNRESWGRYFAPLGMA